MSRPYESGRPGVIWRARLMPIVVPSPALAVSARAWIPLLGSRLDALSLLL